MDPDAFKAFAMAQMRKDMEADPEMKRLFQGVSLEEAAEIYLSLKTKQKAQSRPEQPLTPKPVSATRPVSTPPAWAEGADESVVEKMTRPDALLRVLEEVGHPMTRMDAYREAVRRGYIEEIADPNKHIGVAVFRLIGKGQLKQFGTIKPTRIGLPNMRETEDPKKFFG